MGWARGVRRSLNTVEQGNGLFEKRFHFDSPLGRVFFGYLLSRGCQVGLYLGGRHVPYVSQQRKVDGKPIIGARNIF
jgi:hypothetical protein